MLQSEENILFWGKGGGYALAYDLNWGNILTKN